VNGQTVAATASAGLQYREVRTPMEPEAIAPLRGERVLTDRIYQSIKAAIVTLDLPPGTPLVERNLAKRFEVSKSPVRDALQRLAGEGLVAQVPHRGMFVQSFDAQLVDELYELRVALEELAIRLATPHMTPETIAEGLTHLQRAAEAISAGDRAAVSRANQAFHALFSRCSRNRPLHAALCGLQDRVRVIRMLGWTLGAPMEQEHCEHEAILDAVARGDSETASRLMRDHIDGFRKAYSRAAGSTGQTPISKDLSGHRQGGKFQSANI